MEIHTTPSGDKVIICAPGELNSLRFALKDYQQYIGDAETMGIVECLLMDIEHPQLAEATHD